MYNQNTNQSNNYEEQNTYLPRFKNLLNPVTIVGSVLFIDAAATLGVVNVAANRALTSGQYDAQVKTEISMSADTIKLGCGLEAILGMGFIVSGVSLVKKKEEKIER